MDDDDDGGDDGGGSGTQVEVGLEIWIVKEVKHSERIRFVYILKWEVIGYGGTELTRWTRERVRETNILGVRASTTRYFLADPNAARELPATSVPRGVSRQRDAFTGQGHVTEQFWLYTLLLPTAICKYSHRQNHEKTRHYTLRQTYLYNSDIKNNLKHRL